MSSYLEAVENHLEKYAGPIDFRWENLLFVRATSTRKCHVVLTHGMSDTPMNAPEDQWKRLELCALLPPDWPLDPETGSDEAHLWPLRGLQTLARLPFQNDSWLGLGHTIPNGNPPQPFAPDTALCAWWLLPPVELPQRFSRARLENDEILNVLNLVPLYKDELDIKIQKTFPVLLDLFGKRKISDIIDPHRDSAMAPGPIGKFSRGKSNAAKAIKDASHAVFGQILSVLPFFSQIRRSRTVQAVALGVALLNVAQAGVMAQGAYRAYYASDSFGRNVVSILSEAPLETMLMTTGAVEADVKVNPANVLDNPRATFVIDMSKLDTGIELRNQNMRQPEWMDTDKYPTAKFTLLRALPPKGTKAIKLAPGVKGKMPIEGQLELRGVKKLVRADVECELVGENANTKERLDGELAHIKATFPLKVTDFGVPIPPPAKLKIAETMTVKVDVFVSTGSKAPNWS